MASRWSGPNAGNAATRRPVIPAELDDLELDGFEDDDGFRERAITGFAVAADAERVELLRCTVSTMRWTGARLRRLHLTDVRLVDCDLAQVVLEEASFDRVELVRCRLTDADLGGARLVDVRFTECQLDGAALRLAEGARVEIDQSTAPGLDLYRARLAGARLTDTDLSGADLSGADLARAQLHGSRLTDVKGASALRGASIDAEQVIDAGLAVLADLGVNVTERP